jgi:hypothetical protein
LRGKWPGRSQRSGKADRTFRQTARCAHLGGNRRPSAQQANWPGSPACRPVELGGIFSLQFSAVLFWPNA